MSWAIEEMLNIVWCLAADVEANILTDSALVGAKESTMSGPKTVFVRCRLEIVGRIRVSRTFASGQRSKIGRYEDSREVSLPVLGIGMINEDFHIAGI